MKEKIITDLDDVLADSMPAFLRWLSKELGKQVIMDDLLSLTPEGFFKKYRVNKDWVLTDAQKEFFGEEKHLENLKPYKARLEGLDCSIVTGREEKTRDITQYWLKKNFRFNGELYLTDWDNHKKAGYVIENIPKAYVDDNAQILAGIRTRDFERKILLYLVTRPWNQCSLRGIKDESYIKRVKGFQEAVFLEA